MTWKRLENKIWHPGGLNEGFGLMKPYLNPPKVSNIIAQNLLKAIILHTFEVQVGPKPREGLGLRAYMT